MGYSTAALELIKTLIPVMPKGLDSFVFLNSGSEAIDNAVKLARHATGKPNIIVFKVRAPSLPFSPSLPPSLLLSLSAD